MDGRLRTANGQTGRRQTDLFAMVVLVMDSRARRRWVCLYMVVVMSVAVPGSVGYAAVDGSAVGPNAEMGLCSDVVLEAGSDDAGGRLVFWDLVHPEISTVPLPDEPVVETFWYADWTFAVPHTVEASVGNYGVLVHWADAVVEVTEPLPDGYLLDTGVADVVPTVRLLGAETEFYPVGTVVVSRSYRIKISGGDDRVVVRVESLGSGECTHITPLG